MSCGDDCEFYDSQRIMMATHSYHLGPKNFGPSVPYYVLVCPRSPLDSTVESTVPFKIVWLSAFPHGRKMLVLRSRNCVSPRELENFDFQSPISGGVPTSYLTGMPSLALCEIMTTRTLMSRAARLLRRQITCHKEQRSPSQRCGCDAIPHLRHFISHILLTDNNTHTKNKYAVGRQACR